MYSTWLFVTDTKGVSLLHSISSVIQQIHEVKPVSTTKKLVTLLKFLSSLSPRFPIYSLNNCTR